MKNFYKNKKVLVTGGTGLIGIQLVKKLVGLGAKVTVVSLEKNRELPKKVKYKFLDLRDAKNCISATKGMEIVFHLAGIKSSPKIATEKVFDFMLPMLTFNANMISAAVKNNVKRYMYTSSIGVYSPSNIMKEDDVWKTFPSKNDWYPGWTKRVGELNVEAYQKQYDKMKTCMVRPANVFGPFDNFDLETAMVIPSLINKFINSKNKKVDVWGDGSNIRDFVYSEDVADAMLIVMQKCPKFPVNIGSGNGISIKQIVKIINKFFDNSYEINWLKHMKGGDKKRILDIAKLRKLGFKNKFNIEKSIFDTIKWYKENKNQNFRRYNAFKK